MKKSESITIKDIAHALDLSYSTVSRALQGSYKISSDTIEKVKAYAAQHHYRPNLMAQSLRSNKSRSIGVLLCSVPNNFFAEVINGIESVAAEKDYFVIISQSQESYEKEIKNLQHLTWRSVDGLLVSISAETEDVSHFTEVMQKGTPIVFFDRVPDKVNTHKVFADDEEGAYKMTVHLIESGYTQIAHVTSSPHLSITQRRLEGYKKALAEHHLPFNEQYIKYCMHGGMQTEEVEQAVYELLNLEETPDAFFPASDRLTLKCFSLLKQRGLSVPAQMAIGGFTNFSAPELFCPALTTLVQPAFEMGKTATELLLRLIESKKHIQHFEKKVLPTELIVRASTKSR